MRMIIAFKAFFLVLFNGEVARAVAKALAKPEPAAAVPAKEAAPKAKPTPPAKPARSDALTLLAALQREGRLIDFVKEPIDAYTDAQVGAAARQVHRDCGQVLQRLFDLQPVRSEPEGASVELPAGFDADRCRVTGNVTGQPPFRGCLVHHGWEARQCQLPAWTGGEGAAKVVAPAEVEVK